MRIRLEDLGTAPAGSTELMHQALVKAVEETLRPPGKPEEIHVTSLIAPPCIKRETEAHWDELEVDIGSAIAAFNGIVAHKVLEDATDKTRCITELSLEASVDGMQILGRLDALFNLYLDSEGKLHGTLVDYKTTNATSYKFILSDGAKDEWVQQVNIYKYILETHWNELKDSIYQQAVSNGFATPEIIKDAQSVVVDEANIAVYALGWSKGRAMKDPAYPQVPAATVPITLYKNEDILKFIKARIIVHKDPDYLPTDEEMWTKPWALMVEGRKTPIGYYTTEEKKRIFLAKGQYWVLDVGDIVAAPELNINRCAYCLACSVCHGKYYLKALATKPEYKYALEKSERSL